MKIFIVFTLFSILLLAYAGNVKDYTWGNLDPDDEEITRDRVKKSSSLLWGQKAKYVYKQKNLTDAYTITFIKVYDLLKNGAAAELISGGPGFKNVTITFQSKKNKGINDEVVIYGYK